MFLDLNLKTCTFYNNEYDLIKFNVIKLYN